MSTLTRFKKGDPFIPREDWLNAVADAGEAFLRDGRPTGGAGDPPVPVGSRLVVRVKNDTGAQIAFGAPVMLTETTTAQSVYTDGPYEANASPTFSAVFRDSTTTTMFPQRYGVAMEPIPDDEFGTVCLVGICATNCAASTGWLMPEFTSSSSSFVATTKRTNAQVVGALANGAALIYLSDAPWQTRRSSIASPATVTSATRGGTFGTDGFDHTATATLSAGAWEQVIPTSIIKVPATGIYDFRYNLHAMLTLNGNSLPAVGITGAYPFHVRNVLVMAKIVQVDNTTGAYISGVNWPPLASGLKSSGLIESTILEEYAGGIGYGYAGQANGSAMLETRFSLSSGTTLSVGLMVQVYCGVSSPPSIALNLVGTGIVRPAEQEIYLDPPP